ncbi:hypothetical protein [Pelagibacterium lacus]|nr:hypothetical protein [Pelagibacterium lacus]
MQDLRAWLDDQNGGVRTYLEFHKMAQGLARKDRDNAAILALLGRVAARFAARYEGEPLPVAEANTAIVDFRALVARAADIERGSVDAKLAFANEIATFDIGTTVPA